MKNKLNPKTVALSLASVAGIISIMCAILIAIAPEATTRLFGAIFHGLDISQIMKPITFIGAILGTAEVIVIALVAGWLYAAIYNALPKKE